MSAPVGVFDSGVGGLSILQALRARLPDESFIYVADSGHAPYGERSAAFVESRALAVAHFLISQQAKAMVIACNTASVVAAARLRQTHTLPIVAMEPAIKPAVISTRSKVVLVLATGGTLRSEAVARLCQTYGEGVRIVLQACPGLATQVERGELDSAKTQRLLRRFLLPGLEAGADTIVLGCTHYAFLMSGIAALAGPGVQLIEPSDAIARQLVRVMPSAGERQAIHRSQNQFYTSGAIDRLTAFLAVIGEPNGQARSLPSLAPATRDSPPPGARARRDG